MAYRVFYREDIDAIRDRLSLVARYLRALHQARSPSLRERLEQARPRGPWPRRKPYESLERTVEILDRVRAFYPTREQARQRAYTYSYDTGSGAYQFAR